jgi:uncharacterized protein involved in response to NO
MCEILLRLNRPLAVLAGAEPSGPECHFTSSCGTEANDTSNVPTAMRTGIMTLQPNSLSDCSRIEGIFSLRAALMSTRLLLNWTDSRVSVNRVVVELRLTVALVSVGLLLNWD